MDSILPFLDSHSNQHAIVDAFYPLVTVILAYLIIDERLAPVDFIGMALITTDRVTGSTRRS